jgi:hypothetical protein
MDNRTTANHSPVSGSPFLEANALFHSACWHAASRCVHAPASGGVAFLQTIH